MEGLQKERVVKRLFDPHPISTATGIIELIINECRSKDENISESAAASWLPGSEHVQHSIDKPTFERCTFYSEIHRLLGDTTRSNIVGKRLALDGRNRSERAAADGCPIKALVDLNEYQSTIH